MNDDVNLEQPACAAAGETLEQVGAATPAAVITVINAGILDTPSHT